MKHPVTLKLQNDAISNSCFIKKLYWFQILKTSSTCTGGPGITIEASIIWPGLTQLIWTTDITVTSDNSLHQLHHLFLHTDVIPELLERSRKKEDEMRSLQVSVKYIYIYNMVSLCLSWQSAVQKS